jgi:hypothetical protein
VDNFGDKLADGTSDAASIGQINKLTENSALKNI